MIHSTDANAFHPPFEQLREILAQVNDLSSAASLLHWDQATYMPPGGALARGRQLATLSRLAHEKFVDPRTGELLETLRPFETEHDPNSFEAALIRVTRRDYEKAARVPVEFEARWSGHLALTYETWTRARPDNDFALVRPLLEKTLELSRELASFHPHQHLADPLIDDSDPGFSAAQIAELFSQLRAELVPLVAQISAQPHADDTALRGDFDMKSQLEFARAVTRDFGYDYERGRMDFTHHPFMTKFSLGDVRITVRGRDDEASELLMGALHEAGHGLYEQGISPLYEGTPLANGASSGLHESQSRLWENFVGRSPAFWSGYFPRLQKALAPHLDDVSMEQWLHSLNRVERGLIRTEADELTYNLHVMIRFDLELQMLDGRLAIKDLPDAWNARYASDLGVEVPDDSDGCLQDVHWFGGAIGGAFQGYTLGNILSAQYFEAAKRAHPDLDAEIARGEFGSLREWLTENLYLWGRAREPQQLVEAIGGLDTGPYLDYLRAKYAVGEAQALASP